MATIDKTGKRAIRALPVLLALLLLLMSALPVFAAGRAEVNLPLSVNISGDIPPTATQFRFTLTGLNGAPMPDGTQNGVKTVTHISSGTVYFGTIRYTQPGDYQYEIRQIDLGADGYIYDNTVYVATVQVTWVSEDSDELQTTVVVEKKNEHRKANHIYYTNEYDASSDGTGGKRPGGSSGMDSMEHSQSPQTGDSMELPLWLALYAVSLVGLAILISRIAIEKKKQKKYEV